MSSHITSVVVLAAGQGKRMKSELPKVLHPVSGRPMVLRVLDAVRYVGVQKTIVVLGHGHELVVPVLPLGCVVSLQREQRGTGHALLAAAAEIPEGLTLVIPGDTPLITGDALLQLVDAHVASCADATVLTMDLPDPTGYGRVVRDADGSVLRIVEHRDASPEERDICEVNTGMYILPVPLALEILRTVGTENDQGEIYLTDVLAELRERGGRICAAKIGDATLALGVNSQEELAAAEALMNRRVDLEGQTHTPHQ